MASTVHEIMNPELYVIAASTPIEQARSDILALGITAAPVSDETGRPVGVVSLRDLVGRRHGATARDRMTSPAVSVEACEPIGEAAKRLSDANVHHMVVVDDEGRGVGFVSALDLLRGLIGEPAPHPASFPHIDETTGLSWTDDHALEMDRVDSAPDGPGVLAFVHGGRGISETVVWAEATDNVRTRLLDLIASPRGENPAVDAWEGTGRLRFRAAEVPDRERREDAAASINLSVRTRRAI